MTNREFFEAVLKNEITEDVLAHAKAAIEKLDSTNEKRKVATAEKAEKREEARVPIREAIVACITDEPKTATMLIAEANVEIKPQSIPHLLKGLIENHEIQRVMVKVKGKSPVVGYVK